MSSRISALSLHNLYKQRSSFHQISYFGSKYYCLLTPVVKEPLTSANNKPVQVFKPLVGQSVDEILSNVNYQSISPAETISVLKALRLNLLFRNINSNTFKNDKKFEILCELFEKNCSHMTPSMLVSGLRSLLEVGVSPESSCVVSAEQIIINNIHLFSVFNVIGCLYFHHKYMETDLQKTVVSGLVNSLCKKVSEISLSTEILMLVNFLHIFNEEEFKMVSPKIVELMFTLTGSEMCKMLSTLSEISFRNFLILNALALNLKDKVKYLNMKEILGILYACKNLSFVDSNLLSDVMEQAVKRIPDVKQSSIISGLLTTCGYLRWKQLSVLKACEEWIMCNLDVCRQKEFVSYILTAATLNYNESHVVDILKTLIPLVSQEKIESPDIWLDVIWSLAVLNCVTKDMLLSVLSPEFYKPLIDSEQVTNKLKLMNLKAVLKIQYPESFFGIELCLDPIQIPESKENKPKRNHVIKVLNNFIPSKKFIHLNQHTDMGIFIDAEFIMNKDMKPLPLSEFGIMSKPTSNILPKECHRIALLIYFHKDYTLSFKTGTGKMALATQLLIGHGYTVARVSYQEFIANDTEIKKIKYLLGKITKSMKLATKKHKGL